MNRDGKRCLRFTRTGVVLVVGVAVLAAVGIFHKGREPISADARVRIQQANLVYTLAEQYFDNERLAEAAALHPEEAFQENCRKQRAACDTRARLTEVIPFSGKHRRFRIDEATARLLILSENSLVLFDLDKGAEIQRLELPLPYDHRACPSGDSFPDPLHASTDEFPKWK